MCCVWMKENYIESKGHCYFDDILTWNWHIFLMYIYRADNPVCFILKTCLCFRTKFREKENFYFYFRGHVNKKTVNVYVVVLNVYDQLSDSSTISVIFFWIFFKMQLSKKLPSLFVIRGNDYFVAVFFYLNYTILFEDNQCHQNTIGTCY